MHPFCSHKYIFVLYPCSFRLFTTYLRVTLPSASSYPLVWRQIVILSSAFAVGLHTMVLSFLDFTFIVYSNARSNLVSPYSIEVINTVREIEQVDHIMPQS